MFLLLLFNNLKANSFFCMVCHSCHYTLEKLFQLIRAYCKWMILGRDASHALFLHTILFFKLCI